jgi:hypothetical protein
MIGAHHLCVGESAAVEGVSAHHENDPERLSLHLALR